MKPYDAKDWVNNDLELKFRILRCMYKRDKILNKVQYQEAVMNLLGLDKVVKI